MPIWSILNAKAVLSFPCGSWVRFLIGVNLLVLAAKEEMGKLREGCKELKWSSQDLWMSSLFQVDCASMSDVLGMGTLQLFLIKYFLQHWFFHVNRLLDTHFNKSWFADWWRYCGNPSEFWKTALTLSKAPCLCIVLKIRVKARKPMTRLELWDDSN